MGDRAVMSCGTISWGASLTRVVLGSRSYKGPAVRIKGFTRNGKMLNVSDAAVRLSRGTRRQVLARPVALFLGRRWLQSHG